MARFVALILLLTSAAGAADRPTSPPGTLLEAAKADFNRQDFPAAVAKLDQLESDNSAGAEPDSIRGVIYLEQGKFEDARKAFRAALIKDPGALVPRLYLGEVLVREKKFADAREVFEALERETTTPSYLDLLRYRVLITYLAQKQEYEAKIVLQTITFPTSTPTYYYAQAAWEFYHDKNGAAKEWVSRAESLFDASQVAWFKRPLYDLGWIKHKPEASLP